MLRWEFRENVFIRTFFVAIPGSLTSELTKTDNSAANSSWVIDLSVARPWSEDYERYFNGNTDLSDFGCRSMEMFIKSSA